MWVQTGRAVGSDLEVKAERPGACPRVYAARSTETNPTCAGDPCAVVVAPASRMETKPKERKRRTFPAA